VADDDIRELNALIADYGREFQSPDRRRGPSLGSARLYNEDYTPATGSQQAEMVMSMLPGVGEGLDAAHFAKDIGDRNYLGAGLSGLSMIVPGLGAATIKKIAGAGSKSGVEEVIDKNIVKQLREQNIPDPKTGRFPADKPVRGDFRTEKGSTYEWYDDATTQRYRVPHKKNDKDVGLQPVSSKTVFADPKDVDLIGGIFQNPEIATRLDPIFDDAGKIEGISLRYLEDYGPHKAGETVQNIRVKIYPEVGKTPIEIADSISPKGSKGNVHFGTRIVEVNTPTPIAKAATEFREGPPIEIGDTMQPSLLTSDGETPEVLYRIVSRKEFDKAQESGKFTPSSFYGRIHASSSPDMRYKNAPDDVVIEIKYDPDDGWYSKQSSDKVYGVTKKDIPISRTSKIKQFKKGGSVVERPNNYEPKAI
jgi:hypothetical protein